MLGAVVVGLAIAVVLVFVLALGLMREVLLLRDEIRALSSIIVNPPEPDYVGEAAPPLLVSALPRGRLDHHLAAFVTEGCSGCDAFRRNAEDLVHRGVLAPDQLTCVVFAGAKRDTRAKYSEICGEVIVDERLFGACAIKVTPTLIAIDPSDRVTAFHLGGGLDWVEAQLSRK